jgi:hypothetical protein
VERIDASTSGRVQVAGRWFGVRGRRFMRPALTISRKDGELRALADLDDKPWAAEDGEVWRAAFSVEAGLHGARVIELAVAPDIVIELRAKGRKLAQPGATLAVGEAARAPRSKGIPPPSGALPEEAPPDSAPGPGPRRSPSRAVDLERLGARLASANHALEQERERRAAMAASLEEERTANRQLRTDLGHARSELEIAAAAQAAAAAVAAELDTARGELREAQRRHEALVRGHEEATQTLTGRHDEATQALTRRHEELAQAHAALEEELQEHAAALESTQQALAEERAESGRLRNRLSQVQEARQRASPAGAQTAADAQPKASRRASSRAAAPERRTPDPAETQRFDIETVQQELDAGAAPIAAPRPASRRGGHASADIPAGNLPPSDRLRPLNPSLRHRTYWAGRLLALIFLLIVIGAVWIVLHSTVLH